MHARGRKVVDDKRRGGWLGAPDGRRQFAKFLGVANPRDRAASNTSEKARPSCPATARPSRLPNQSGRRLWPQAIDVPRQPVNDPNNSRNCCDVSAAAAMTDGSRSRLHSFSRAMSVCLASVPHGAPPNTMRPRCAGRAPGDRPRRRPGFAALRAPMPAVAARLRQIRRAAGRNGAPPNRRTPPVGSAAVPS